MTRHRRLCVLALFLFASTAAADDKQILREARIGTDGPALLDFFKNRITTSADRDKIAALIKKLGDDDFEVREKTSADLIAIGGRAEAQLREAARGHPDAEIKCRAEKCLREVRREAEPEVQAAAARVLGARHAEGAAAVLLEYLPQAPEESVVDAISSALEGLAVKDGKADTAIVKALEYKSALRRTTAAVTLIRAGRKEQMTAVRKLLTDHDSKVRLRVAVALAFAKDKDAVPALIDLLGELPSVDAYEAEDILLTLAGDAAPMVPLGNDAAKRKKCRDAWQAWWKKEAAKVNLAKLSDGSGSGRTLIVQMNDLPGKPDQGRVMELGRDGKVRWQIEGLHSPTDAQLLPGGRVLICEFGSGRLTERNILGEILWEKKVAQEQTIVGAQRLPNGNTFVATTFNLLEFDRNGKEVWSYRPQATLGCARKSPSGDVALLTRSGTCVLLDAKGKKTSSFQVDWFGGGPSGIIDLLPNGNVLIPETGENKVSEYDRKGKVVWEADVELPSSAVRLADGHTLVTQLFPWRVIELDKDGKQVWKCETDGPIHKAYRR